ncbi:succinate dehydrogenase cytochrome b subunit [Chondromyces apiculatus]|uniref:Succinate dehydrogenase cytochrome b subunit n=1 Tax=Chondromyces apiculatus DSM 436 TaxID=1192034 RepID=A0A017T643_9BACT|nr:succinate dehydrogenase cytochrome b subunit [Chondromyces apiculatus]EYF04492.1 Succinate dehydrogenase cytochrome b subunit [Chondromyces apiculatus DSM 436]
MSTIAASSNAQRLALFYREVIGKKIAMALSGVVLFGYVVIHMAGNLQLFAGREQINDYAAKLHSSAPVLWGARAVLLTAVIVHIYTAIALTRLSYAARPDGYRKKGHRHSNLPARTMLWSGMVLAAFIVFHLLHLTTGTAHPQFQDLKPYDNMVAGFQMPVVALFYVISVVLLGAHLYHGAWSMFQSLGISHPRYTPALRKFAVVFAFLLTVGFAVVPLAVLFGVVR